MENRNQSAKYDLDPNEQALDVIDQVVTEGYKGKDLRNTTGIQAGSCLNLSNDPWSGITQAATEGCKGDDFWNAAMKIDNADWDLFDAKWDSCGRSNESRSVGEIRQKESETNGVFDVDPWGVSWEGIHGLEKKEGTGGCLTEEHERNVELDADPWGVPWEVINHQEKKEDKGECYPDERNDDGGWREFNAKWNALSQLHYSRCMVEVPKDACNDMLRNVSNHCLAIDSMEECERTSSGDEKDQNMQEVDEEMIEIVSDFIVRSTLWWLCVCDNVENPKIACSVEESRNTNSCDMEDEIKLELNETIIEVEKEEKGTDTIGELLEQKEDGKNVASEDDVSVNEEIEDLGCTRDEETTPLQVKGKEIQQKEIWKMKIDDLELEAENREAGEIQVADAEGEQTESNLEIGALGDKLKCSEKEDNDDRKEGKFEKETNKWGIKFWQKKKKNGKTDYQETKADD